MSHQYFPVTCDQGMSKIIIIYSTTDGHTRKICDHLVQALHLAANQVMLINIDDVRSVDLQPFDKVVLGASIRYGKHHKKVYKFIAEQQPLLETKANAFFSVNVVARKPGKNQPDTNPYLKIFLKQISWQPKRLAVFAGKLDYPKYNFFDRNIIRFIMWMTKGPTDPKACIEFTDWSQVSDFAKTIDDM